MEINRFTARITPQTGRRVEMTQNVRGHWRGIAIWSLGVAGVVAGCAVTQQEAVKPASLSGFLGDYSKLTPGGPDQASLRYLNPTAQWTQYKKIVIEPVTFWGGEATKVSAADQEALCNFFYQALRTEFAKKMPVVDEHGAGVLRLQVALTDVETATPGLRTISMVVPQARLLGTLKYAATGTYAFVGGAQAEARLTDAATGQILGEWVDKRVGGGSVKTAAQWKSGDAENAMTAWAELAATRIASWTAGTTTPK
jgi:hypothetical protein